MILNEETVKGHWLEIRGEVQKAWGKITNDELEQVKGDMKSLAGLVQRKYGEDKAVFDKKFGKIWEGFNFKKPASKPTPQNAKN